MNDTEGNEQIFLVHYDRLLSFIVRNLPLSLQRQVEPEDVLQETFARAWRRIGEFEHRDAEATLAWLKEIARNALINLQVNRAALKRGGAWRQLSLEVNSSRDDDQLIAGMLGYLMRDSTSPGSRAARAEQIALVRVAMTHLDEAQLQALQLRFVEGRSAKETAALMDRTEGAVWMLCHRALRELRKILPRDSQSRRPGTNAQCSNTREDRA